MSDERQWYQEYQDELHREQDGLDRQSVTALLQNKRDKNGQLMYSHVFDPDNAPPIKHIWVDRGAKLSCEGAGHPMHQAWKRRRS